jgi:hypothetical protein
MSATVATGLSASTSSITPTALAYFSVCSASVNLAVSIWITLNFPEPVHQQCGMYLKVGYGAAVPWQPTYRLVAEKRHDPKAPKLNFMPAIMSFPKSDLQHPSGGSFHHQTGQLTRASYPTDSCAILVPAARTAAAADRRPSSSQAVAVQAVASSRAFFPLCRTPPLNRAWYKGTAGRMEGSPWATATASASAAIRNPSTSRSPK